MSLLIGIPAGAELRVARQVFGVLIPSLPMRCGNESSAKCRTMWKHTRRTTVRATASTLREGSFNETYCGCHYGEVMPVGAASEYLDAPVTTETRKWRNASWGTFRAWARLRLESRSAWAAMQAPVERGRGFWVVYWDCGYGGNSAVCVLCWALWLATLFRRALRLATCITREMSSPCPAHWQRSKGARGMGVRSQSFSWQESGLKDSISSLTVDWTLHLGLQRALSLPL